MSYEVVCIFLQRLLSIFKNEVPYQNMAKSRDIYRGHMPWSFPTVLFNINIITAPKEETYCINWHEPNSQVFTYQSFEMPSHSTHWGYTCGKLGFSPHFHLI